MATAEQTLHQAQERHQSAARPQLAALTGVRFFAALYVVVYHIALFYQVAAAAATGEFPPADEWCAEGAALFDQSWFVRGLSRCGFVAVSLFFTLSGFILTYTSLDRQGQIGVDRREFWAARFARIYPVYLVGLLINIPVFFLTLKATAPKATAYAASSLLLLQAWWPAAAEAWNSPGWSLSAEAFFYFTFPFLVIRLARHDRRRLWLVLWGTWMLTFVAPLAYEVMRPDGSESIDWTSDSDWLKFVKYNPLVRLPEFVFGMTLGLLYGPRAEAQARQGKSSRGVWALVAIALIVALLSVSEQLSYLIVHNALLLPLFGVLICDLALGGGPLGWLLSRRPLVLLGDASYALYILHTAVIAFGLVWMWLALGGLEHLERQQQAAAATDGTAQPIQIANRDSTKIGPVSPTPEKVLTPLGFVIVCSTVCVLFSIVVHKLIELPCRRYLRRKLNKTQHLAVPPIVHSDLP